MKEFKRILCAILCCFFMGSIINVKIVQASDDVQIISSTNISKDEAKQWAKSKNATDEFVGLADLYWKYSKAHGGHGF